MQHLFVMDPIEAINIKKDTTFSFMMEAQSRGHGVHVTSVDEMGARPRCGWAYSRKAEVRMVQGDHVTLSDRVRNDLDEFDVIWMRKDPPFSMDYVYATYLLEQVNPKKTLVLNNPQGIRDANEKAFILNFPQVIPDTIITKSAYDIRVFVDTFGGQAVIKPLDQMGGKGIFKLRSDDANLGSIIDMSTKDGTEFIMVQRYVPDAAKGDKRILLMDGEPLGAVLRVPPAGEFRGNFAVGGTAQKTEITERDRQIIGHVAPELRRRGLTFVGLDVLGTYLTEINVTSPTGVREINRLNDDKVEERVLDWVVQQGA